MKVSLPLLLLLAGCGGCDHRSLHVGMSESEVVAACGEPSRAHGSSIGDAQWVYGWTPFGVTYVYLNQSGRVTNIQWSGT